MHGRMFREIEAVIFDLDGTLVDSMWVWNAIDEEYFRKHGLVVPDGLQERISGMSFSETAEYIKTEYQITDSIEGHMEPDGGRKVCGGGSVKARSHGISLPSEAEGIPDRCGNQ